MGAHEGLSKVPVHKVLRGEMRSPSAPRCGSPELLLRLTGEKYRPELDFRRVGTSGKQRRVMHPWQPVWRTRGKMRHDVKMRRTLYFGFVEDSLRSNLTSGNNRIAWGGKRGPEDTVGKARSAGSADQQACQSGQDTSTINACRLKDNYLRVVLLTSIPCGWPNNFIGDRILVFSRISCTS